MHIFNRVSSVIDDFRELFKLPKLTINLMHKETLRNDAFYSQIVRSFYYDARARHPKCPLLPKFRYGVATCVLPENFDNYFMNVEASARRNYKKAQRCGYAFSRIQLNDYLNDIAEIRRSAEFRQGKMSDKYLKESPQPVNNPPSATALHDYPYFGILRDGVCYAYAGCVIAGEVCLLEHIFGHAGHQSDGIVPMLIVSIAEYVMQNYPNVKYYVYGSYFGAGETMRRFKTKLGFIPHRVVWKLEG